MRVLTSKPKAPRRHSRNFSDLERRRRHGMKSLMNGLSQSEVARQIGVSEPTVFRWKAALKERGPTAWRRGTLGRPRKVLSPRIGLTRSEVR